jgi:hypothetical protein
LTAGVVAAPAPGRLPGEGQLAEPAMLLLFSRTGFGGSLRKQGDARSDVELIDLHRLYGGG